MATPATQQRTVQNAAISTAPEAPVAEGQSQQHETSDGFQEAPDVPQVSKGFSSKVGRYSEKYAENKLKTGYLTQI